MNKIELKFAVSNLKKAIYYAECTNKFSPETIDKKIIEELKIALVLLNVKSKEVEEK